MTSHRSKRPPRYFGVCRMGSCSWCRQPAMARFRRGRISLISPSANFSTARMLIPSNESTLCQGHARPVADDDVIQQADVHQREGLADTLGDQLGGLTGLGYARGVIVGDDHRRRISLQRLLDDFPRMHAGAVDRAAKQFLELNQPVAFIQVQTTKYLVLEVAQAGGEKVAGGLWAA